MFPVTTVLTDWWKYMFWLLLLLIVLLMFGTATKMVNVILKNIRGTRWLWKRWTCNRSQTAISFVWKFLKNGAAVFKGINYQTCVSFHGSALPARADSTTKGKVEKCWRWALLLYNVSSCSTWHHNVHLVCILHICFCDNVVLTLGIDV